MKTITCPECNRGMIPNFQKNVSCCYVCYLECDNYGNNTPFTFCLGELLIRNSADIFHAMTAELETCTQKELARRMGVSEGFLSDVLNDRREISPAIAKYYGLVRNFFYMPDPQKLEEME